ncbi:tryptophan synthase beta subunit-like PLP-dependent enzyme [Hesseltinella vesiculosa]|uniref:L-serine ammonia-lyase n=1 Tax=Hesseltinella vesiculosa TaxID=101127 RepID=A0A1X2G979_9FUNG|nr:tryptophan synthase beta subunit-like PLP-dependent enzyme [Hesseltinella vesiculosa]
MLREDDSSSDDDQYLDETQCLHVGTPLIHSSNLSLRLNSNIFLKMENIQPSGSVKIRGIGNFCYRKIKQRGHDINFVTGSGINTALAVAYCARQLRVQAMIVVPANTNERLCEAIRQDGAQLIKYGEDWSDAENHARKLVKRNGIYVPSADHEHIWQGYSSIIFELKTQLLGHPPAAIVCPVGGGGLLNGIIMGLQEVGWKQVPVIAVETHGSNAFQSSVVSGKLVQLPKTSTLASSLNASSICAKTLELSLIHPVVPFAVSDAMAANASLLFTDDNRMLVEAASGAALSICYTEIIRYILPSLSMSSDVVVLVTGGSDISLEDMEGYRRAYDTPPVVVKSGSDSFLKLDDTLVTLDKVDLDEPTGISPKVLQEFYDKKDGELKVTVSQDATTNDKDTADDQPSQTSPPTESPSEVEDSRKPDQADTNEALMSSQSSQPILTQRELDAAAP